MLFRSRMSNAYHSAVVRLIHPTPSKEPLRFGGFGNISALLQSLILHLMPVHVKRRFAADLCNEPSSLILSVTLAIPSEEDEPDKHCTLHANWKIKLWS